MNNGAECSAPYRTYTWVLKQTLSRMWFRSFDVDRFWRAFPLPSSGDVNSGRHWLWVGETTYIQLTSRIFETSIAHDEWRVAIIHNVANPFHLTWRQPPFIWMVSLLFRLSVDQSKLKDLVVEASNLESVCSAGYLLWLLTSKHQRFRRAFTIFEIAEQSTVYRPDWRCLHYIASYCYQSLTWSIVSTTQPRSKLAKEP